MTIVIKSAGNPCYAKIATQQRRNLQYPALPGDYENPRQRRILMKIIAAIVSVAALVGTIACGTSDLPVAQPDAKPTARPTIEALIPIATPANTLTLITPTPGNTSAPNSRQSNSATTAATGASPAPDAGKHCPTSHCCQTGRRRRPRDSRQTHRYPYPLRRPRRRPQLPARR